MRLPGAFWRLATASAGSNTADGVLQVALPLLALQLTRSPVLVAGVAVAARLPWLLFALVAGVVADRVDRRRLMLSVTVVRVGVLGGTAVLVAADAITLWQLYLVVLVLGVVETLFDTAAQSLLPMVLPPQQLPAANSRLFGVELVAQTFVGPPLGGLLAGLTVSLAVTGGAAAYAVAALALLSLRGGFRAERPAAPDGAAASRTVRQDVAEGVRYLWREPALRRLAALTGAVNVATNASFTVLPLFALAPGPMGLSATGFGLLLAASGVGALLASLVAERALARLGPALALRAAIVVIAAMVAAPLLVQPVLVGAVQAVGTAGIVVWNVLAVSLRQRVVPEHLLGRVHSAYRLVAWGAIPLGAVVGGVLAEVAGLRTAFVAAGAIALSLVLATRGLSDERLR